jgi:hypothetical protein
MDSMATLIISLLKMTLLITLKRDDITYNVITDNT